MKNTEKRSLGDRMRSRMAVQNEPRLYFVLQLVFAAAQILLAYVAFGERNLQGSGVAIFAVYGVLLMLQAGKFWQHRGVRVLGRTLSLLVPLVFVAFCTIDVLTTRVSEPTGFGIVTRNWTDYAMQLLCYLCLYLQALMLFLFPTFSIAARRQGKRGDIAALRLISWVQVLLAIGTLILANENGQKRMDFSGNLLGIGNTVLLWAYLICTVASVFAVFISYPYGVAPIKYMVARVRGQQEDK